MLIRITEEENIKLATTKFGKKAIGLWKSFQMFDKHPPYAWKVDDQVVAICHITFSPRTKYCNLYYIEALVPHHGYGQKLYDAIVLHMLELGMKRMKLSSEPEAISFWCDKNYFWFFSYDKYGSLKADVPLDTRENMKVHRANVIDALLNNKHFDNLIPTETKHLEPPLSKDMTSNNMNKALASMLTVTPYFVPELLKKNDLTSWI